MCVCVSVCACVLVCVCVYVCMCVSLFQKRPSAGPFVLVRSFYKRHPGENARTTISAKQHHTLLHTATHCNTLQHISTHCKTLLHPVTNLSENEHRTISKHLKPFDGTILNNAMQHTATHCNTPQHTWVRTRAEPSARISRHSMGPFWTHRDIPVSVRHTSYLILSQCYCSFFFFSHCYFFQRGSCFYWSRHLSVGSPHLMYKYIYVYIYITMLLFLKMVVP